MKPQKENGGDQRGLMVGTTPLTRWLPSSGKSPDRCEFLLELTDDAGNPEDPEPEEANISESVGKVSDSGSIEDMFSNSLTICSIEGRSFVSCSQHWRANAINLLRHSDEYGPMRLSITEYILPDWHAEFTCCCS